MAWLDLFWLIVPEGVWWEQTFFRVISFLEQNINKFKKTKTLNESLPELTRVCQIPPEISFNRWLNKNTEILTLHGLKIPNSNPNI